MMMALACQGWLARWTGGGRATVDEATARAIMQQANSQGHQQTWIQFRTVDGAQRRVRCAHLIALEEGGQ